MNRPGNPLGLGLLIVGAGAMAIAAFLLLDEPTGLVSTTRLSNKAAGSSSYEKALLLPVEFLRGQKPRVAEYAEFA